MANRKKMREYTVWKVFHHNSIATDKNENKMVESKLQCIIDLLASVSICSATFMTRIAWLHRLDVRFIICLPIIYPTWNLSSTHTLNKLHRKLSWHNSSMHELEIWILNSRRTCSTYASDGLMLAPHQYSLNHAVRFMHKLIITSYFVGQISHICLIAYSIQYWMQLATTSWKFFDNNRS